MKFIKQAIEVTLENHEAVQQKLLEQGYQWVDGRVFWSTSNYLLGTNKSGYIFWVHKNDVDYRYNRITAEEFLQDKTMNKPFYIYTPTPKISQEVQKRLFDLGYEWYNGDKHEILKENYCCGQVSINGKFVSQNSINPKESVEVSLRELFSDDFPRVAPDPARRIPKGELLPDYEVVVTKDLFSIPELSATIPMEEIRKLAEAIFSPAVPKLNKVYIHAPGPELMKFVYDKLVSMGYPTHIGRPWEKDDAQITDGEVVSINSWGSIDWGSDFNHSYWSENHYKLMTIPELFSLPTAPALPDLAGYPVSLTKKTLKVGCQEIPLEQFNQFIKSLETPA